MPLPLSKSQIVRLGERLVKESRPSDDDLDKLGDVLFAYDETLASSLQIVRDLGFDPTGRVKNTGTILEKLQRHGGSWLKSIQDLAGMRIVISGGWREQDEAVAAIRGAFEHCSRGPQVVDRRIQPSHGYRAVHVIIYPDGMPVEIQVRTRWQHEWADMFEKFADFVGRGVRYGEPIERWWNLEAPSLLAPFKGLENFELDGAPIVTVGGILELFYRLQVDLLNSAIAIGDLIAKLEADGRSEYASSTRALRSEWDAVREMVDGLRANITSMTTVAAVLRPAKVKA
ncbi:nucleotidyltransferase family protein [Kitasatospora indigofera]|uniref:hypothetical protein n=1 Tax=Kitasatospora indigofera TaxID=67307 RepID=UPI00367BDF87